MSWSALQIGLPPGLSSLTSVVTTVLNAVKTALQTVKAAVQAEEMMLSQTDSTTTMALNMVIQQVVATINTTLTQILDNSGVYLLVVPLPKKGIVRIAASRDVPDQPGSNYVDFPVNNVLAGLPPDQATEVSSSPTFQQIFNPTELFLGGNAYFVRTLTSSIFDAGDLSRPKFHASDSWAYALVVAGASDLTSVLSAATFIDRLVAQDEQGNGVGATRGITSIVPQHIRVGPSVRGTAAVVQWDPVVPSSSLPSFGDYSLVATKYAVIRSSGNFKARTAMRVTDLFSSNDLTVGMTGQYGATVVQVANFDGITTRWIDTSVEAGTTYWYHVAFASQLSSNAGNPPTNSMSDSGTTGPTDLGFDKLSASIEFTLPVTAAQSAPTQLSVAPDWTRTPSVAQMFPAINNIIDVLQTQLQSFAISSQGVSDRNTAYLAFLDREVARYSAQVDQFTAYASQLQAITSNPTSGMYATTSTGTGDIGSFVADLTQKFSDTTDPNRPPFDGGSEFVTGLVILAVGPDPGPVAAAFGLLNSIFNPPATDPVAATLASIQQGAAKVEQALIDKITGPTTNSPQTFNADMTPRAVGQGDASCDPPTATTPPAIGPDGLPTS